MAFRFLPIALLALGASALMQTDEPEEEEYFRKRGRARSLQYTRAPDATQTGCTPKAGGDLPKTTSATEDFINEPCYVHDAACDGYPVCCVRKDTCVSTHGGMISSNSKYYEGGCVSPNSRAKALPEGCAKQGECHAMYLEHMKAGTAKAGVADAVSPYVVQRLMVGADGCDAYFTPPIPIFGFVLIAVGAVVVLLVLAVGVYCMTKKKPAGKGGAPEGVGASA